VAVQEVADDVTHIRQLLALLGDGCEAIYTDVAGNQERLGYLFKTGRVRFHLYWSNMAWRRLEANALGKWAKSRLTKAGPPHRDIILLGDFNMPHARPGDPIYDELAVYGLTLPKHTTDLVGTNLAGDKNYDEVAFFPSHTEEDFGGCRFGSWYDGPAETYPTSAPILCTASPEYWQ
jgi:hypothetical protein